MRLVSLRVRLPAKWWTDVPGQGRRIFCEPVKDAGSRCAHKIHRSCANLCWTGTLGEERAIRSDAGQLGSRAACPLHRALIDSGCHLDGSTSLGGGIVLWSVIAPTDGALKAFADRLERGGAEVVVERTKVLRTRGELTLEEDRMLLSALERGYFDSPRRADLDDLAEAMGLEKGYLQLALDRARRKLVAGRCCD